MPQFNADGDVIDIALNTIKVQNWDKTITVIPTHKFLEHGFRNWQTMFEGGGRRIKRAIHINTSTIQRAPSHEYRHAARLYHCVSSQSSKVHQGTTLLVRQLAPTPEGVPIEIYAFTNDTRWANYEGIQADIFDHILSIVPEFDLSVYQRPSGRDTIAAFAEF